MYPESQAPEIPDEKQICEMINPSVKSSKLAMSNDQCPIPAYPVDNIEGSIHRGAWRRLEEVQAASPTDTTSEYTLVLTVTLTLQVGIAISCDLSLAIGACPVWCKWQSEWNPWASTNPAQAHIVGRAADRAQSVGPRLRDLAASSDLDRLRSLA